MTLIERLREQAIAFRNMNSSGFLEDEAADEIERLTKQRDELAEALQWVLDNEGNERPVNVRAFVSATLLLQRAKEG